MDKIRKNHVTATVVAVVTMAFASGSALAGGFLDLEFDRGNFDETPNPVIDNEYWPLAPNPTPRIFTYIGETEDECVIDQVSANDLRGPTYEMQAADGPYAGLTVVQIVDTEWVFEDLEDDVECEIGLLPDDAAIKELTLDWYLQDKFDNIWYMGELSRNYEEECGPYDGSPLDPTVLLGPLPPCFEGSWEAGLSVVPDGEDVLIGQAGIVVPSDMPFGPDGEPLSNGTYYFQEVAFEAEDMAKILRQDASLSVEDGIEPGEYDFCRKVKEWNPFEPGESVEHKWYCTNAPGGLVLIEGVGGGPTEVETLVEVTP